MKIQTFKSVFLLLASVVILTACQSRPPVPEPRYTPDIILKDSIRLEVLPWRDVCHSATPMQCLLVKPVGASDDEVFGIGYNDIIGFSPSVGVRYQISVREQIDQNTGKATGQWQLEEILSQNFK